ncbi:MAG: DNA primase [Chlorobi bacterium]|nr:DNA primase [Chlorobiota bacterium]
MGYLSRQTIEKVREAARVEEVVADFVQLKRVGANYRGFSPFKEERTPSFYVSPAKQIWKDFSSGKGGDVVKFLMEHEKMTFPEAIRWLAKKYHIEIEEHEPTEEEKAAQKEKESLYVVLDFARKWFMEQLYETDEGRSVGLSYFKGRGFLEKTLRTFETGYSPARRDAFYRAAIAKGYKEELLEKAGLIIRRGNRVTDRFFDRVIFPIHALSGNVVAFAGRILRNDVKAAKYINSPETEVYHKSKILYGIFQAKQSMVKEDAVYLVEGYTDVMSFHQAGIVNTVASAGTSLTPDQVKLIKRFTQNVILVYDGDPAGIKAAMRGTDIILEQDMNVEVVVLPEGEDPDSFAKKVPTEELIRYLETQKQDFIRFKASFLLKDEPGPLEKFELIREVLESIARIPNRVKQELYVREVARLTGTREDTLFIELNRILRNRYIRQTRQLREAVPEIRIEKSTPRPSFLDKRQIFEREIIKLLLLFGNVKTKFKEYLIQEVVGTTVLYETREAERTVAEKIFLELQADEIEFSSPEFKFLWEKIMDQYRRTGEIDSVQILREVPPEYTRLISDLLTESEKFTYTPNEKLNIPPPDLTANLDVWVTDVIYRLRLEWIKLLLKEKSEAYKKNPPRELTPELEDELRQIQLWNNLKKLFGEIVGQVILP